MAPDALPVNDDVAPSGVLSATLDRLDDPLDGDVDRGERDLRRPLAEAEIPCGNLEEEHGLSRALPWPDVAAALARRLQIAPDEVLNAAAETRFLPLSRALASLERRL